MNRSALEQIANIERGLARMGVVAALVLAAGCGGKHEKARLGFAASASAATTDAASPAPMTTVAVRIIERDQSVGLTGTLEADEQARVASKISGNVQKIFVDRGSIVKKDDPLIQLDPTDARNSLAEGTAAAEELRVKLGLKDANDAFDALKMPDVRAVKATLDLAERNYRRYKSLSEDNAVAKSAFDRANADYDAAREQYEQAQRQARQTYQSYKTALTRLVTLRQGLTDTRIVASFDGMVAEKLVALGERVDVMMGGGRVITLVKVNPLRLTLTVPQQYVGLIRQDQLVDFDVEGVTGKTFQGRLTYIGPSLDTETRSLTVEALVANADYRLRPGQFATARLSMGKSSSALFVPMSAVRRDGDVTRIFVARDGVAREKIVTLGEAASNFIQILAGLDKDDKVLVNPAGAHDGMKLL